MKSAGQGLAITVIAMTTFAGCGTEITSDTTLQELLTASGMGNVTVGEVLDTIEQFTGNNSLLPFGGDLTQDQQDQLKTLQDQFDSDEITLEEFQLKAESILGVSAGSEGRPVGMGQFGPFPGGFGGREFAGPPAGFGAPADPLDLTDDQKVQAETIFDAMRPDILKIQEDAQTKIDAVLTDEQREELDSSAFTFHGGFRFFGAPFGAGALSESLELTDDQKTQIQSILDDLRKSTEARREQAREEFRAILTADQQATHDQLVAEHHPANASN